MKSKHILLASVITGLLLLSFASCRSRELSSVETELQTSGQSSQPLTRATTSATASDNSSQYTTIAQSQATVQPDPQSVLISLDKNVILIGNIDDMRVGYSINNNSTIEIYSSPDYEIELFDGINWLPFPFSEANLPNWPSVNYSIPANGNVKETLYYWDFADSLTSGKYRIVKTIRTEDGAFFSIYAEYLLKNDPNLDAE